MAPVSSTQYPHAAVSAMQQEVRQVLSVFRRSESSCNLIAGDKDTCIQSLREIYRSDEVLNLPII